MNKTKMGTIWIYPPMTHEAPGSESGKMGSNLHWQAHRMQSVIVAAGSGVFAVAVGMDPLCLAGDERLS